MHRFKKGNFGAASRTPCGGRVIAFKWPGPSSRKNLGDSTDVDPTFGSDFLADPLVTRWLIGAVKEGLDIPHEVAKLGK